MRLIVAAQGITSVGDGIVIVALSFAVLSFGGVSDLALVLLARQAATAVAVLPGGVVADRLSKQRLVIASLGVRCVAQLGCAALVLGGTNSLVGLALFQVVYGAASALQWPAFTGLMPQLVDRAELQAANAWLSLAQYGVAVVGPAVGGVVVAFVGAGWGLAADAATFVGAAVALAATVPIRTVAQGSAGFLADLREGWRLLTRLTWVWAMLVMSALFNLVALPAWLVLGPALVGEGTHGAARWGSVLAVAGLGAISGSLLAMRLSPREPFALICVLYAFNVTQLIALGAMIPDVALALTAFVASACFSVANTVWSATFQSHAPPHALSRLSSYTTIASTVPSAIGYALIGPLVHAVGASTTLYAAAAFGICVTLTPLLARPVRRAAVGLEPRPVHLALDEKATDLLSPAARSPERGSQGVVVDDDGL